MFKCCCRRRCLTEFPNIFGARIKCLKNHNSVNIAPTKIILALTNILRLLLWPEILERLKLVRVYTVQAHGSRAAQMHCVYTAPKQNVQKIISLRIFVVSKRLKCVMLETRNIKKNYRLLPGRKHFRLQMICKRPSNYTS